MSAHVNVFFPEFHQESAGPLPAGVRLVDPGLSDAPLPGRYRPATLPLAPAETRVRLRDLAGFGDQFRAPRDLAFYGAGGHDDRYAGTTFAIRDELETIQAEATQEPAQADLVRAQLTLALAWTVEEQELELARLDGAAASGFARLSLTLAQDQPTSDDSQATGPVLGPIGEPAGRALSPRPWKPVLEALLTLLPAEAAVVTACAETREEMEEFGLAFAPADPALLAARGLEGEARLVEAPGWRLLCLRRPRPGAPWLDRPRRLFFLDGR